ncbi:MAG: DoxX family protein [Leptospirales bacterium]
MKSFFSTTAGWPLLIVRLGVGGVLLPHGFQKLLGWFGGFGWNATVSFFSTALHIPVPLTILVILGESLGSVAMILGFMTRFVAIGYLLIMLGAISLVHWQNGFFMNWFGTKAGEGFEYHLLVISMAAALLVGGGGKWSVDGMIARRSGSER